MKLYPWTLWSKMIKNKQYVEKPVTEDLTYSHSTTLILKKPSSALPYNSFLGKGNSKKTLQNRQKAKQDVTRL